MDNEETARKHYEVKIEDKVIVTLPFTQYRGKVADILYEEQPPGLSILIEDEYGAGETYYVVKEYFTANMMCMYYHILDKQNKPIGKIAKAH